MNYGKMLKLFAWSNLGNILHLVAPSCRQELEAYKQKNSFYERENQNLQDELSEVYNIKSQVCDLYKTETEKNKALEEELKFLQTNVSTSLAERDRLILEIEKVRTYEQTLEDQLRESRFSMQENKESMEKMRTNLNQLNTERQAYHQVVNKFWKCRTLSPVEEETVEAIKQAQILVSDPDESWTFSDSTQMEPHHVKSPDISTIRTINNALQDLKSLQMKLKDEIQTYITIESRLVEVASNSFRECYEKLKTDDSSSSTTGSQVVSDSTDTGTSTESTQGVVSREAYLRALQDKVSALMLLSQEEERHHLEIKSTGALEYQLKELSQTLSQVTLEKVEALMQAALLKQECQQLKDRERELLNLLRNPSSANTGGRLLPASWDGTVECPAEENIPLADNQNKGNQSSTSNYFKSWLRRTHQ